MRGLSHNPARRDRRNHIVARIGKRDLIVGNDIPAKGLDQYVLPLLSRGRLGRLESNDMAERICLLVDATLVYTRRTSSYTTRPCGCVVTCL